DLQKALKGLVVMSEALESMSNSLARNAVPSMWSSRAYPSLKPLAAWVKDLCMRVQFMQQWADGGIPKVFWISGFYFPQAFLTGALQNYARKHVIAIDTVSYAFEALQLPPQKKPDDGCCVSGLFLEGARWNGADMALEESRPKELHTVSWDPSSGKCLLHLAPLHSINGEPRPSGPCDSFNVVSPTSARPSARPALVTGPPVQDSLAPPLIFRARHMTRPSLFQLA
ncbi:jg1366, partial [Pararge aegeria aegeria]